MATGRLNFMPPNTDPESNWDVKMRGIAGGDPRFFDYGRFGLLDDTSVLKSRVEGPASYGGSSGSDFVGSGMAPTKFSGGQTGDDPGGYNWDTFERNLQRGANAVGTAVAFRMENKRMAAAKQRRQDEEFIANASNALGAVYGAGQDPLTMAYVNAGQRADEAKKANQAESVKDFAGRVVPPSQNLTAEMQAKSSKVVAGASRPIKGRKSQPVNLLYPNGTPGTTGKKGSRKPGNKSPYSGPQPPVPPII